MQGGGYGLAVALKVSIPGVDSDTVRSLTEAARYRLAAVTPTDPAPAGIAIPALG